MVRGQLTRKENAMRSALLALATSVMLASVGCHHNLTQNGCGCDTCGGGCATGGCASAGGGGGGLLTGGIAGSLFQGGSGGCDSCGTDGSLNRRPTRVAQLPQGYLDQRGPAGPAAASYGYPYYTTRAPRDFLMDNPPSIGY